MKRFLPLTGGLIILFLLIASTYLFPQKIFIYNYTDSLPHGIYFLHQGVYKKGVLVAFHPPEEAKKLIHDRKYLRDEGYLMKYIAGEKGDSICTGTGELFVDGKSYGLIRSTDSQGKPLPRYSFCGRLKEGYIVAIKSKENSFDSRYFGPINRKEIIGVAEPVWLFNNQGSRQ